MDIDVGCCVGDSLFAPLDSVTVRKVSEDEQEGSKDLAYLRLLLPMQYVLDDIQDPQLVQECRLAAQEVRLQSCSIRLLAYATVLRKQSRHLEALQLLSCVISCVKRVLWYDCSAAGGLACVAAGNVTLGDRSPPTSVHRGCPKDRKQCETD